MTLEGGKALIRDLNEYCNVSACSFIHSFIPFICHPSFLAPSYHLVYCFTSQLPLVLPLHFLRSLHPTILLHFSTLLYSSTLSYPSLPYIQTMAVFESPETVDMMICLKEILEVTLVPPESVVKVRTHARTFLYMHVVVDKCICICICICMCMCM